MPYVIQTVDKPGGAELRASVRAAHLKYLDTHVDKLLAAGAFLNEDGSAQGSLIIVDTDERTVAEELAANDPYNKAGLFEKVTVTRWRKGYYNRQKLV